MSVQRTQHRSPTPGPAARAGGHTVQPGETLSGIARQHGVSTGDLVRANPEIRDPNLIRPGQQIRVPTSSSAAVERQAVDPTRQGATRRRAAGAEQQLTTRVAGEASAQPNARRAFATEIARLNGAVAQGVPGAREALAGLRRDRDGVMTAMATVEKKIATNEDPATWARVQPRGRALAEQADQRSRLGKELADLNTFGVKVAAMNPKERQDLQNFFQLAKKDPEAFKRFVEAPPGAAPTRGTSTTTPTPTTTPTAPVVPASTGAPAHIQAAIDFGMSQVGAPYVGGASPFRFGTPGDGKTYQMQGQRPYVSPRGVVGYDCSGLMVTMLQKAGIDIRAFGSSRAMKSGIPEIPKDQLRPGDLLVKNGHVAMYTGNGQMIEATPSGGVKVSPASTYINNAEYSAHRPG